MVISFRNPCYLLIDLVRIAMLYYYLLDTLPLHSKSTGDRGEGLCPPRNAPVLTQTSYDTTEQTDSGGVPIRQCN